MKVTLFQKLFDRIYQSKLLAFCLPGLSLLAVELAMYFTIQISGSTAFFFCPMPFLIDWILWDPQLLLVRLHDMGLSVCALAYAVYEKDWAGVKQLINLHLVVGGITHLLKYMVARQRPNGGNHSFPSGHTSSVFSAAAFIHERYGITKAIPAYAVASTIGCIRVYKKAHYPTDVLAGAGIAILTAYHMIKKKPSSNPIPTDIIENRELRLTRNL